MLFQLFLDERHRKERRIDRHIQFLEHVRYGSDMVLVAVRDDKSLDFAVIFHKISDIRDDEVHSQHVIFGERKTAVDDHDAVPVFKRCHIHPDLLESAERDDLQLFVIHFSLFQKKSSCSAPLKRISRCLRHIRRSVSSSISSKIFIRASSSCSSSTGT